jgi:hypothetical protein
LAAEVLFVELESIAFFDEPASPSLAVAPPSPEDEELEAPSPEPVAAAALVFEVLAVERSFLAQPEPLKCTAGGTKTLRSVSSAPQVGQNRGAGASIPWMNSVRVEQFEQT